MNGAWLVVGLGVAGAIVALVTALRRGEHATDLGAVSSQWIAEHRFGSGQDSSRR
jgi:hypothetical protein